MTLSMAVSQQEEIPLETRARILFLTAGIVLLTILINGSTCKLLVEKLRLISPTQGKRGEGGREGGRKGRRGHIPMHAFASIPPSLPPSP